jgi:hypothetical protein
MRDPRRSGAQAPLKLDPQLRVDLLVGGLVLIVYAAVQLWLLLGPQPFDPAYYFDKATPFPPDRADYWTLRIGLIVPLRLAIGVFGPSEAAFYAIPLAGGLLLVAAVYVTMLSFFRDRALAVGAALVVGVNPIWLLNSSSIFPDTISTATFTAGMASLVLGRPRPERDDRHWTTIALLCAAGFFFGLAYLIRELSPILLPAVIAAFFLLGYRLRQVAIVVGAATTALIAELVYGQLAYGDPLIRMHVLLNRSGKEVRPARQALMAKIREEVHNPLDAVLVFPRLLLNWESGWVFFVLLGCFLLGLALFRDRRLWLFAPWCFGFWAVMAVFGVTRLKSGELLINVTNMRYWYPIFPPLVMGAFGSLGLLVRRYVSVRPAVWLAASIPAILAAGVIVPGTVEFRACASRDLWRNETFERWDDVRSWLSRPDAKHYDTIWSDTTSGRLVPVFTRAPFGSRVWQGKLKRVRADQPLAPAGPAANGALILVDKRFRSSGLEDLRADWRPVFMSRDGWILLLRHRSPGEQPSAEGASWWEARKRPPGGDPGECGLG